MFREINYSSGPLSYCYTTLPSLTYGRNGVLVSVNTIMIPLLIRFLYYFLTTNCHFLEKECKINRIIGILLTLVSSLGSLVIGVVYSH